jgi:hypothetical protein
MFSLSLMILVLMKKYFSMSWHIRNLHLSWIEVVNIPVFRSFSEIIVASVKVAASFEKKSIGIEDFLLALIKQSNSWFLDFLDFIRINVRDFEGALVDFNRSQTGTTGGTPDLGKIMNVLEQGLLSGVAMEDVEQNPVFSQMSQNNDQNQKSGQSDSCPWFLLYWYHQRSIRREDRSYYRTRKRNRPTHIYPQS